MAWIDGQGACYESIPGLLTKPVAVVYHLPFVFTAQFAVRYFQRVEFRYMMSSDLFFSLQLRFSRWGKTAAAISYCLKNKIFYKKHKDFKNKLGW